MSQFLVRYQIDSFEYSVLDNLFEDSQINHFEDWVYKGHSEVIRKKMTSKLNSEWITRNYLSVKMILSATTMLTSLEYAIEKNLQVTVPYLSYYSLITCCRAFCIRFHIISGRITNNF